MPRFSSRYTRDVSGIFDNAGSYLNGSAAFEDAVDFAGLGERDSSNMESALRLRMMASAKSGRIGEVKKIERTLLTLQSRRQMASRKLSLGKRSGTPNSEIRMNAVMRRGLMQDQTLSQDALAKAQVTRLEQRFQEMPIVDLGPLRFTQGSQAGSFFQSLNGLSEDTIVHAAQAVNLAKFQQRRLATKRRKIVKAELRKIAKSRGQNPSYFVQRYGNSFSPMDGFGAVTNIDANTVALPVAELQQLLLDNGADPYRLISSRTGKPDGIGGETTSTRANEIGRKFGFELIRVEYFGNNKQARVTPGSFIAKMQGVPETAQASSVRTVKVQTKKVQEALMKLGSPSRGLIGKNGKPDNVYGTNTAAALADQAKKNNLPLSTNKGGGRWTVIAPGTTWLALEKLSKSAPKDVGTASQEVATKDVQATLLVLGSSPTGLVDKNGKPDGDAGSRTKQAFREQANKFGLPISKIDTKGRKRSIMVIAPATTWFELTKRSEAAMAGQKATSSTTSATSATPSKPSTQERKFASAVKVANLQQWLLNLGAPRAGLVDKVSGNPDGKYGKHTEAALKKIAKGMGYSDVLVRKGNKGMVQISPPELQSALVEGSSGRNTTTVETSEQTQLVEAKKEIAVKPARAELARKAVDVVNAYISKHKKPPRSSLNSVKDYQKTAKLKVDGKWGPDTRSAVASDLNVAESSLPISAYEKKVVAPPKTVSVKDRATKALNAVLAYIERKGKPPAIVIAEVKDFQRAFIASSIDSPYRTEMKKKGPDGKYGPTTRGAIAAALGSNEKALPISAFDKGVPPVRPTEEDRLEEKVEKKKADTQERVDKTEGGEEITDSDGEIIVQKAGMGAMFSNPWLIGGAIAIGLLMSKKKKPQAGLPASF